MKTTKITALVLLTLISRVLLVTAEPITISASADTYLTEYGAYGGVTSTHGADIGMVLLRGIPGLHRSVPLISFDLSPYAGKTIIGPTVELVLPIRGGWDNTIPVSIRESMVSWDESTASYANFGGTGFNEAIHTGINIASGTVSSSGSATFSIPSSVVQNWIDNSAQNMGLFVISETFATATDKSLWSREGGSPAQLNFDASGIPEPSIIIITPLNADGCVEATSPTGARIEASVGNFIDDPSIIYYWSNSEGVMTNGTNFVFELGINEDTIIFLTAEDTVSGETASSFKQVRVSDTTPPNIIIISPEYGDTFTGNNLHLEVEINDVADYNITDYVVNIGSKASYPLDPETGTSRVKLSKPALGTEPISTDITVTAEDASGNVSSATVQVKHRHDLRK